MRYFHTMTLAEGRKLLFYWWPVALLVAPGLAVMVAWRFVNRLGK